MITIVVKQLSPDTFAPYGDVIDATGTPDVIINQGMCGRFHDLADLDFASGRAAISLFEGKPYKLPLKLQLMERHPLGSQAFLPMSPEPFLVVVAEDNDGKPHNPQAFLTAPGQGVNYFRNTWHGVLTPLVPNQRFAVVDRVGDGNNLEEYVFEEDIRIVTT